MHMNKFKEYGLIIILALVLLGGAFYWYEWRSMMIVKTCNSKAIEQAKDQKPEAVVNYYEFSYRLCLRLKGVATK